jgi:hypothetical protein
MIGEKHIDEGGVTAGPRMQQWGAQGPLEHREGPTPGWAAPGAAGAALPAEAEAVVAAAAGGEAAASGTGCRRPIS